MRFGARGRSVPELLLLLLLVALLSLTARVGHSFTSGQSANKVVGQVDFASMVNPQHSLRIPGNIIFDNSGNLWVAEADNNRVVEFRPPFSKGMNFSLVLGQSTIGLALLETAQGSLYNPSGMAFDSSGNLWVADTNNNRVLEFTAPFSNGMDASLVIGQSNFTASASATSQSGLNAPSDVIFDPSGNLWITDELNSRVVEFKHPLSSGMLASLVLGESSYLSSVGGTTPSTLYYPSDSAFDSSGNLWVADLGNNRVLEYKAPLSSGMAATVVLGQSTFTSSTAATTQYGLSQPGGVFVDPTGNVWISDGGSDRVLEFVPLSSAYSSGTPASLVVGQTSFTASVTATSQSGLDLPGDVAFDPSGNLWVADVLNNRVLEFKPPFSTGISASLVVGQSDFVSNLFGGEVSLRAPQYSTFDSTGNLWVVDQFNNRVLEFRPPLSSGIPASLVIGQTGFGVGTSAITQSGLTNPLGLAFDSSGDLWISDQFANRILEFKVPLSSGMGASLVLGQSSFTASGNATSSNGFYYPGGLAFDSSGNLWAADTANDRVLEFRPPFSTGMGASLVLGQSGFTSRAPATSQSGLFFPADVKLDPSGNLWVSDEFNNRLLEFKPPFSNGKAASLVIGQSGFISNAFSSTQNGLYIPQGLTFDFAGNLWVADAANSRVVEFKAPFSIGMPATSVLGQPGFNSGATATSQSGLRFPAGIVFDSSGNLWVSDKGNNRMLEFQGSASTITTTSSSTSSTISTSTTSSTTSTSTSSQSSTSTSVISSTSPTISTSTSTTTSTSTKSSTSTVPEFPVGLPVVFAAMLVAALLSYSYWKRRPVW